MAFTAEETEMQRRLTEARARIREGYTIRYKVDELMVAVEQKRGRAAADQLREDMREQWRIRRSWLEPQAKTDAIAP